MVEQPRKRVAIFGSGPVGAFAACCLARRGYQVDVYERRTDVRSLEPEAGRSISVDISCRGWEALNLLGLCPQLEARGVRVSARMIHDRIGNKTRINYGSKCQSIIVFKRQLLNQVLIEAAERCPNVRLLFSHKLVSCNMDTGEVIIDRGHGDPVRTKVDLIIGADGAFSVVRQQMMMKLSRFDYQQVYIPHGYMELYIPPTDDCQFAMEPGCHHLWPRQEYMVIAQPNDNKSYTVVLVMSFTMYHSITTEQRLLELFRRDLPDLLCLIDEKTLLSNFFSLKLRPLISTKCHPYHVEDKVVILGDAAHAMLPFYGQGMNCGLEDCVVLCDMLDKHKDDLSQALPDYTATRHRDASAITDLTLCDYIQMYSRLNSRLTRWKTRLDDVLYWMFPRTWIPLYTMVSFTRIPYSECMQRQHWQDMVMRNALIVIAIFSGLVIFVGSMYTL